MGKIITIGGVKMMIDEEGKLHPIPKKYYDINESHSNNLALKRPSKKNDKVSKLGTVFEAINDKGCSRSTKATKVVMNENTMKLLSINTKLREDVYNLYGLHTVEHIINSDIEDNIVYIHYDDMRYEAIYVGKNLIRKKHFAEKLMDNDE